MENLKLKKYAHELNQSIMAFYLDGFQKSFTRDKKAWIFDCQKVLRNYVLTRPGWKKSVENNEEVILKNKHSIDTHIVHNESPGVLMIRIAKEIAKAELVDGLYDSENKDKIFEITKCVENEDWAIPFVRRKLDK